MNKTFNKIRKWIRRGKPLPHEFGPLVVLSPKSDEECCAEGCCVNKTSTDGIVIREASPKTDGTPPSQKSGKTNKGKK